MKYSLLTIFFLSLFLVFSQIAKADGISISFGYNDFSRPSHHSLVKYRNGRPHRNKGRYAYGYYYAPAIIQTTVIKTNNARADEKVRSNNEKLGISDIIILSKAGLSDEYIIKKIAKTKSTFDLTVEEIEALRKEEVSAFVINFMLNSV